MMVVENVDERHLDRAQWLFPLYLLAINLFVLPIAIAGRMLLPADTDPDNLVLSLPLLGGAAVSGPGRLSRRLSAAASMVVVETTALSLMVCNDVVMPALLRVKSAGPRREAGPDAAAALDPAGGHDRRHGARLPLHAPRQRPIRARLDRPDVVRRRRPVRAGNHRRTVLARRHQGGRIRRYLGGLPGLVLHAAASLLCTLRRVRHGLHRRRTVRHRAAEALCALRPRRARSGDPQRLLVDARQYRRFSDGVPCRTPESRWSGRTRRCSSMPSIPARRRRSGDAPHRSPISMSLAARFLGRERAAAAFASWARTRGVDPATAVQADAETVLFYERLLAGVIGAASARVLVGAVVEEEPLGVDEMMRILDETSRVIEANRQLEDKSRALEAATAELREANARLQVLDRLKDDFVATVNHELRTPLASIRAFSEILRDHPDLPRCGAARFSAHRGHRIRTPDPAHQPAARPLQDRGHGIDAGRERPGRSCRRRVRIRRRHAAGLRRTPRQAAHRGGSRSRLRRRRSRPAGAGDDQSPRQCGQVLAVRQGQGSAQAAAHRRGAGALGGGQWSRHPRRATGRSCSNASGSSAIR